MGSKFREKRKPHRLSLSSGDAKNKGERTKGDEGVTERRESSFNFLLAGARAANLRLRARFDRKEGRKEEKRGGGAVRQKERDRDGETGRERSD